MCKSKTMSVTNLELFVVLYCCRSAHSALHKRNTQPILMRFKITVPPQQLNSKILQTQLHKRTRKAKRHKGKNLKFRDRTAKPKDHVTQETMKYIKIISIWRERHDNHCENLDKVMTCLKLTKTKCEFMKDEIKYCRHLINQDDLCKPHKKIEGVVNVPCPQNVNKLRSWLGFVSYYHKFLPNLATELQTLHWLLKQDTPWHWKKEQETGFKRVKSMEASGTVFTHYEPEKGLRLVTDASVYGLGCVLYHVMPDGSEKPTALASRTLKDAEKGYLQSRKYI